MTGILFAFGAAFSWATFTVLMRLALRGAPLIPVTALLTCANALAVSLVALAAHGASPLGSLTGSSLAILGLGGLLHFALSRPLYYGALQQIGPSRAVPVATAYPFFTALLGALLLGEPIAPNTLAGVSLIVCGTALLFGGAPAREEGGGEGGHEALSARARGQLFAVMTCLLWGST
ncbi:MAG: EamA family transporter, partial [Nitrospinota bacterium]